MRRLMAEYQRGKEAWWKNERAKTLEEVTAEVVPSRSIARSPRWWPGKMDDGTPVKLDQDDIGRRYGEGTLRQLPRGFQRIYASEGAGWTSTRRPRCSDSRRRGHAEILLGDAPAQGTDSGRDGCPDGAPWRPDDRWSDRGKRPRDALHNERRADVLATELRALNRKIREATPVVRFERQKANRRSVSNVAALDALPSPPCSAGPRRA